jgi:hypothetical protein
MQALILHSKPLVQSHVNRPTVDFSILSLLLMLFYVQKIKNMDKLGLLIAIIYPFAAAAICGLLIGLVFTSVVVGLYVFFIVLAIWLIYYLIIIIGSALIHTYK